ncbi:HAMP domain-containing histidine kinase [Neobacillus mesonae]|nr:HAMP domain-containing histidine kinase [Neobacillus mesonae]
MREQPKLHANGGRIRFKHSLMSRYLLIVIIAMVFLPVAFMSTGLLFGVLYPFINSAEDDKLPYGNSIEIESAWHEEAKKLSGLPEDSISSRLAELGAHYKESNILWVDNSGMTRFKKPESLHVQSSWKPSDAVEYMKNAQNNSDIFTVVAFIGGGQEDLGEGFISLELPRQVLSRSSDSGSWAIYNTLAMIMILGLFMLISWSFFRRISKRLTHLEVAVSTPGADGIPLPVEVRQPDEIGHLEKSFNGMVYQLRDSRARQQEEEQLRKNLIADLSHDLRTPLTVVRGHLHALHKEPLTVNGQESLHRMEGKIDDLGGLIDNLLSYNLLSSGKYTMKLQSADVLRILRESSAAWYPIWESEGLHINIELGEQALHWNVDIQGFRRVLDNLFQNVVRHAKSGKYVRVATEEHYGKVCIVVEDHGPGIGKDSKSAGAGIGLMIVDLLLEGMGLIREAESSDQGTKVFIIQSEASRNLN